MTKAIVGLLLFLGALWLAFWFGMQTCKNACPDKMSAVASVKEATTTPPVQSAVAPAVTPAPAILAPCVAEKHIVVKGDILTRLALRKYGRASANRDIAKASSVKNPDHIEVGWVLTFPCNVEKSIPVVSKAPAVKKAPKVVEKKEVKKVETTVVKTSPSPTSQTQVVTEEPKVPTVTSSPLPLPQTSAPQTRGENDVPAKPAVASSTSVPPVPNRRVAPKLFGVSPTPPAPSAEPEIEQMYVTRAMPKPLRVGSLQDSIGNSPLESGNRINSFHVDQALLYPVKKVYFGPYVAVNAREDNRGRQYNNTAEIEAGVKIAAFVSKVYPVDLDGFLEFGGGYALEARRVQGRGVYGHAVRDFVVFAKGGLEWQQPFRSTYSQLALEFPGRVEGSLGYTSPVERNNLIGKISFEQGVTVAKIFGVSYAPTVWAGVGKDSAGNPLNNRNVFGGGFKYVFPWWHGDAVTVTVGRECAREKYGGRIGIARSACGNTVNLGVRTVWGKPGGS